MNLINCLIVMLSAVLLTACMSGKNYTEIYVKECDFIYKEVTKAKIKNSNSVKCETSECVFGAGAVYGLTAALSAADENIQQQIYFEELKEACAKKGITLSEIPQAEVIYSNRRKPIRNKANSDSDLSDIER